MAETRNKMDLNLRAKQFLPFDAMKGLKEAIKAKEYEVEATSKNIISQDEAERIAKNLLLIDGKTNVKAKYFSDGHEQEISGICTVNFVDSYLRFKYLDVQFDDLIKLEVDGHLDGEDELFD
ncbi:MAG: hypothetical protein K5694_04305 [Bacilli bacterium]|nr:hypothetical protein [Bacilli bacterium]